MSKTIPPNTKRNLNHLQIRGFCSGKYCNRYKHDCATRVETTPSRWYCADCAENQPIDFLRGDRR